MVFWSHKRLHDFILSILLQYVGDLFREALSKTIYTLKEDKAYLLVLPESIPSEDVQSLVSDLSSSRLRLYVVQADNVKIVEF